MGVARSAQEGVTVWIAPGPCGIIVSVLRVDVSVKLRGCGVVWTVSGSVAMMWVTVLSTVE